MASTTEDVVTGAEVEGASAAPLSLTWVYGVCGLLLLASTINYMDRQTLSGVGPQIRTEFGLSNEQYGQIEGSFGFGFAFGALLFGAIADRVNIRWFYPVMLLLWSSMGFLTGWATSFWGLLICRTLLGLFEAGHWPCALKTTQRLLPPAQRTLGNSVLQSGTAIGAIITPIVLWWMLTDEPGSWRPAFQAIGLVGAGWVVLWLLLIRGSELAPLPEDPQKSSAGDLWSAICHRRFLTLMVVVVLINAAYHIFRVWLPQFLVNGRQYSKEQMLLYQAAFYVANDVGCLGAGALSALLPRIGWRVHSARLLVFTGCTLLTALSLTIPYLPAGWPLLWLMLLVSMGLLGMFPCYYAFSQELTQKHQGKVTGLLGVCAWVSISILHPQLGAWIDRGKTIVASDRYGWVLAVAGLLPLLAVAAIYFGWGPDDEPEPAEG
ncbi:MAG: MFS transporter [Planctomycetaceae bacterium]|nr:MFS transporter [Planctomycetaceae bacterium]